MQLYAFWRPAPMPLRITKPCNRLLEASHDPAEVIRQMCAGLLSDVVGQAVNGFGHSAGNAGKRIGISAKTDGRSHCAFPVRALECCGVTIGMVLVADMAARGAWRPPVAMMTFTLRLTRSTASSGRRSS